MKIKLVLNLEKSSLEEKYVNVYFKYNENIKEIIKSLPIFDYASESRCFIIPYNMIKILILKLKRSKIDYTLEIDENLRNYMNSLKDNEKDIDLDFITKPYKHQIDAVNFGKKYHKFILGDEQGCLSKDTEVYVKLRKLFREIKIKTTLEDLYHILLNNNIKEVKVLSLVNGRFFYIPLHGIAKTGEKNCLKIRCKSGKLLKLTNDHKVLTDNGWVESKELKINNKIYSFSLSGRDYLNDYLNRDYCLDEVFYPFSDTISRDKIYNSDKFYKNKDYVNSKLVFDEVAEIIDNFEYVDTYDLSFYHEIHNFVANNLVVHNCGKAVSYDTNVVTPYGFKKMRDIQVNDEVIDSLGNVAKVTNCYDHDKLKFYKITFSDGSTVECCEDHLWKVLKGKRNCNDVDLTDNENFKIFDTKTIISKMKKCKNKEVYYIPDIPKINNTKIDEDTLRKYLILGICLEYANKQNLDICDIEFGGLLKVLSFAHSDKLINDLVKAEIDTLLNYEDNPQLKSRLKFYFDVYECLLEDDNNLNLEDLLEDLVDNLCRDFEGQYSRSFFRCLSDYVYQGFDGRIDIDDATLSLSLYTEEGEEDEEYVKYLKEAIKEDKIRLLEESLNEVVSIYVQDILPILTSLQSLDLNSLINLDESSRSCVCLGMLIYDTCTCIYTNSEIIKDRYNPNTETLNNIANYLLFCCIFTSFANEYSFGGCDTVFRYLKLEAERGRYGLDFLNYEGDFFDEEIVDMLFRIRDSKSPIFYNFKFIHYHPIFSIFATIINYFYLEDKPVEVTIANLELFKYILEQSSDNFKFLFNSLGYVSYLYKNKELRIRNVRSSHRYIKSIEYIGNKPGKCISVDSPQETYMVESFIVTHNTKEIIDLARYYRKSGQIKRCLVICGVNGNKYNWYDEVGIHSEYHATILGSRKNKKTGKWKIGTLKDTLDDINNLPDTMFLIINIEKLRGGAVKRKKYQRRSISLFPVVKALQAQIDSGEIGMIVVDECHKCKNPLSQQTQALLYLDCDKKALVSGTLIMNSPLDLYVPFRFLGLERRDIYQFENRYAIRDMWGSVVGYKNGQELMDVLTCYQLRRLKEEVLDLPEKIQKTEYIELSSKEQTVYNLVNQGLIKFLAKEDEEFRKLKLGEINPEFFKNVTDNPLSIAMKLRQTTANLGIVLQNGIDHSSKMDRMEELLEEMVYNGEKCIIYSNWSKVTNIVLNRLAKYNPAYITGEVNDSTRNRERDRFQNDENCKVIIGTVSALGTGFTLTAANNIIFLDEPWTKTVKDQAEDRCFVKNSPILTPLGYRNIQDLKVGDCVITSSGEAKEILDCWSHREDNIDLITLRTNKCNKFISCTSDHKILLKNGKWVTAESLSAGDQLFNPLDDNIFIISKYCNSLDSAELYDITVKDDHNFIVGDIVAHNCHRIGTEKSVNIYTLIAKGTADETVHRIVEDKGDIADLIIDGKVNPEKKHQLLRMLVGTDKFLRG